MRAGRGAFATKTGAEGVYIAILPGKGLGLALEIDDGAGRAAEVALVALLGHLGALDETAHELLRDWIEPQVRNWVGTQTGVIRPARDWLA